MDIIVIACPIALPCELLSENAPIWVDNEGNEYRVASGIFDTVPENVVSEVKTVDGTIQIVYSNSGYETLIAMGLTPLIVE
jgi:hypothetical protein